jgi:hypothetical protein
MVEEHEDEHQEGDDPGVGSLRPTAMERTLRLVDAEPQIAGLSVRPPCDADGRRR